MSYTTKYPRALALGGVTDVALAAKSVIEDPCLFEVATMLLRLNEAEQRPLIPTGKPAAPVVPVKGIGLCRAVKPIKAVLYVRERPWILPLGVVAIVGGLVGVGYLLGKGPRR